MYDACILDIDVHIGVLHSIGVFVCTVYTTYTFQDIEAYYCRQQCWRYWFSSTEMNGFVIPPYSSLAANCLHSFVLVINLELGVTKNRSCLIMHMKCTAAGTHRYVCVCV